MSTAKPEHHVSPSLYRRSFSILIIVSIVIGSLFSWISSVLVQASPNAPILVTTAADSGPGSLRSALFTATTSSTISFDNTVFPPTSPVIIFLQSPLPTLTTNDVIIDASNAGVVLDGSQIAGKANGLIIESNNVSVHGLTIRRFSSNGVYIEKGASANIIGGDRSVGSGPNGRGNQLIENGDNGIEIRGSGNFVRGNYIGIDLVGSSEQGNTRNGVILWKESANNTIGGNTTAHRNVISGNGENGIWIADSGTTGNVIIGNFIGIGASGSGSVANAFSGVAIQNGAQNNRIGDAAVGAGNVISGNSGNGIYISDDTTMNNQILGNIIGLNAAGNAVVGQGLNGIEIQNAGQNYVGNATTLGRNTISGASYDGIAISGINSTNNTVQSNYIGTDLSGTAARPNGLHGVEIRMGASGNRIGGNRLSGEGNLLSGNGNHGVVINDADNNVVAGNIIGPDFTGMVSLGNHPAGGIDIANTAAGNTIGGELAGEGNIISGNRLDGIALFGNVTNNQLLSNTIGLNLSQTAPVPNQSGNGGLGGFGILLADNAVDTVVRGNVIAGNESHGIDANRCIGNTISQNQIFNNGGDGISSTCAHTVNITAVSATTITGTTTANATVEFYSDDNDEGGIFEGSVAADSSGAFTFTKPGGFSGPNVTANSILGDGSSSEFSVPLHMAWTFLIYLNGDNDLDEFMQDTIANLIAAGESPRANVLVLLDGADSGDSRLYDVTYSPTQEIPLTTVFGNTAELNLGDGQTLIDFVNWGRSRYPVEYAMLSIVNHGGGWAPSSALFPPGALSPRRVRAWGAGNSGLSWDLNGGDGTNYDYLDGQEMRQVMEAIAAVDGPIDVLYYDVCLMGLIEVAAQIQPYAGFFVSSQNIGWAPLGPQNRYIQAVRNLAADALPADVAQLLVNSYSAGIPLEGHPYTVSAIDLSQLPTLIGHVEQLGNAVSNTLTTIDDLDLLTEVYENTQKIDYDSDLLVEADTDGFVDLYDFARIINQNYSNPTITDPAQSIMTQMSNVVVAESHRSGTPWFAPDRTWSLDNTNGLSIFLPLGEDLELPIVITDTIAPGMEITRNLRLRDLYTNVELDFLNQAAGWGKLIQSFYNGAVVIPGLTQGPVDGLQDPDVTPPQTIVTATTAYAQNEPIQISWVSSDTQNEVAEATLWYATNDEEWIATHQKQTGSSGLFTYNDPLRCGTNSFAVRSTDTVGNLEGVSTSNNLASYTISCQYLPMLIK